MDNEDFNDLLNLSTADERKNALYKYDYDEKIDEVKIIDNFDFNNVDLFIHNQDRI